MDVEWSGKHREELYDSWSSLSPELLLESCGRHPWAHLWGASQGGLTGWGRPTLNTSSSSIHLSASWLQSVTSLCLLCHRGAHLLDKVQIRPPVKLLASVWHFTTSTRKQILLSQNRKTRQNQLGKNQREEICYTRKRCLLWLYTDKREIIKNDVEQC